MRIMTAILNVLVLLGLVVLVWLLANIPTAVLLVIYFACREKKRRKKQIERMNIQDLG